MYDFVVFIKIPFDESTLVHVIQKGKCKGFKALNKRPKMKGEFILGNHWALEPTSETCEASMKLIMLKYTNNTIPKAKR